MKKIISVIMSVLMIASVLVSCAPQGDKLDPAITLASSDAYVNAQWLDERLEEIPDDVVIGIGSNNAYGIDMTDFENDGYIMREMGGEVLLFGATEEGLDLAVRKYARAAQKDQTAGLDETYHEGVRVEKLTIAGNDISTYAVVYDSSFKQSLGMEVSRLVKKATGIDIPTGTEEAKPEAEHYIYVDIVEDDVLNETGCRYKVENGDVYIEGIYELGIANGIYLFFEEQCGWEDLIYGNSNLHEAESVDVPEGASNEYVMMFDYFGAYDYADFNPGPHNTYVFYEAFENDRHIDYIYYGRVRHACHGISNWIPGTNPWFQPCYTNEANIAEALDRIYTHVTNLVNAGQVIGKDINFIDLAQVDAFNYCMCKTCSKAFKEENRAHSGAVVRFANRIAEEMEAVELGGIKYGIFAYHGSNVPCKSKVHDDVRVTFCTDGHCSKHSLDSGECYTPSFDMAGYLTQKEFNNFDYAEWIRGWTELTDHLYVWFYTLDNNMHQYCTIHQIYDDFKFFNEVGVEGLFWQMQFCGMGIQHIQHQLGAALNRNPDMTEDEYWILLDELLEKTYGDGWHYIREYINLWEQAELRRDGCGNTWNYIGTNFSDEFSRDYMCENWEYMLELIEDARYEANSAKQERYCELLSISPIFMGCAYNYFDAYNTDDQEMLDLLEERYDLMIKRMKDNGINPASFNGVDNVQISIHEDIHQQAWLIWNHERDGYESGLYEQKPMPQEWADYIESSNAAASSAAG